MLLVIDDDPDIRDALGTALVDEGFQVLTATDGQDALHQLRKHGPPELILLDLMMPVMDGYAFRAQQLADPSLAQIPVVVLTAGHVDHRATAMGAAQILAKPVELEVLLTAIDQHRASVTRSRTDG